MPRIPGLRSPHARVGNLVYIGRMLDKIRLHARGLLPADYVANLGEPRPVVFDARCCRFLGVPYGEVRVRTLAGGCDEEVLAWALGRGTARSEEDCLVWNNFMAKLGWRDDRTQVLRARAAEYGLSAGSVETNFELIDVDEGRPAGATRSWEDPPVRVVIVMGVSGCGKTTIGRALAGRLGWDFLDADDLHPPSNRAKMASGIALDDADRAPWLEAVREDFDARTKRGARTVVACSALRQAYRDALAPDPAPVRFAHLRGSFALIEGRIEARKGHFMGENLLRSQFDTLEQPLDALDLDVGKPPDVIVERIREVLGLA